MKFTLSKRKFKQSELDAIAEIVIKKADSDNAVEMFRDLLFIWHRAKHNVIEIPSMYDDID